MLREDNEADRGGGAVLGTLLKLNKLSVELRTLGSTTARFGRDLAFR